MDDKNILQWSAEQDIKDDKCRPDYDRFLYEIKCNICETPNRCWTQSDKDPEYYSNVFLECKQCMNRIRFSLPVN